MRTVTTRRIFAALGIAVAIVVAAFMFAQGEATSSIAYVLLPGTLVAAAGVDIEFAGLVALPLSVLAGSELQDCGSWTMR